MRTPRAAVTSSVRCALLALTLCAAAQPPALASERLTDAVRAGDAAAVTALLKQGASGQAADADGTTALHWAVQSDNVELARALLRSGAHARAANRYGVTPLALAAENGNVVMMTLLLEAGADVNAAAGEGETVLMTAARTGRPEAVKLLLAHGAEPNAAEHEFGETALMWAAGHGHADAIRALAAGGANLNARAATIDLPPTKVNFSFAVTTALPRGGLTALMYAARQGEIDAVTALAETGADLDAVDPEGTTALVIAIINAHYDVAAQLAKLGANPNVSDAAGMTALYAAVDMVHMAPFVNRPSPRASGELSAADLTKVLLEHGAEPNAALRAPLLMRQHNGGDPSLGNGATPLMRAAKAADVELMRTLLDHKADPSRAMANGNTALLVTLTGRPGPLTPDAPMFQAVQLLLDRGANVNAAAANGETLLHRGVTRGEAFVRMLVEHKAKLDLKDAGGRTPLDAALGVPPPAPAGRGPGPAGPPGVPGGAPLRADDATVNLLIKLGAPRALAE